jgi:alkylation response protein AidB-like acyl-CoA dehydrogenase
MARTRYCDREYFVAPFAGDNEPESVLNDAGQAMTSAAGAAVKTLDGRMVLIERHHQAIGTGRGPRLQDAHLLQLLVKTAPEAQPRHTGMSLFIAEKGPGFTVSRKLEKLGYKSIDSAELVFDDYRVSKDT